jgi:hypothetical protein
MNTPEYVNTFRSAQRDDLAGDLTAHILTPFLTLFHTLGKKKKTQRFFSRDYFYKKKRMNEPTELFAAALPRVHFAHLGGGGAGSQRAQPHIRYEPRETAEWHLSKGHGEAL